MEYILRRRRSMRPDITEIDLPRGTIILDTKRTSVSNTLFVDIVYLEPVLREESK